MSVVGRGTSPSAICPHVSVLTKESLLPPLLPFAPLTASLCIHLPFSQSADNHNGMQVRYLVGARAAVGRWVSMRHYVMAFETVFHSVHPACGMKNAKISRRQSQRDAGALLGGSKGCGRDRFEGHWSRFQRKAPICSKTCVINRVVQERGKFADFQGSKATG